MHVSTCTRPDISFAVGKLSQVYSEPTDEHYSAALMVLSYLGGSSDAEIRLGGRGKGLGSEILSFIDSDFAKDVTSRKSVSGMVTFMNNSPIQWSSKKQRIIAQHSTEAEYLAVFYGRNEIIYLQNFLSSIGISNISARTTVFQDNTSTISLITENNARGRTKYFDVKLRIIHDDFIQKRYQIQHCGTEEMIADLLTKALAKGLFTRFREDIMEGFKKRSRK